MASWIERTASSLGKTIGAFRRELSDASRRTRAAFIGAWAEAQKWTGGNYSKRGAQRRAMQNSWIYAAVEMIAHEVSAARFGVVKQTDVDAEPVSIPNHDLERLLRRPNPWIGRAFLWVYTALWLELDGNAYWFISCDEFNTPYEIWPLPSQDMEVRPGNSERFIDHYEYTANGTIYRIPSEYIVHFCLPNPFDIFRGLSPLAAAMLPVDSDTAMARWNGAFFGRDNVMPSSVINLSSGDPKTPINPADAAALKSDLRSSYAAASRKTAITTAQSVQAVLLGWNPKEMDFIQGRVFTKDEIFTIYGIPGGLLDKNATEANATTADRVFKEKTIWPLLVLLAEQMTAELVQPFYGVDEEATFDDIRPANRALELSEVSAAGPYLTKDEIRKRYWKLEPLPNGAGRSVANNSSESEPSGMVGTILSPAGLLPGQTGIGKALALPMPNYGDDLRRWKEKAVKAFKMSKSGQVKFESDLIPDDVSKRIRERLALAQNIEEIKAAFQEAPASSEFFRRQGGTLGRVGIPPGRYLAPGFGE